MSGLCWQVQVLLQFDDILVIFEVITPNIWVESYLVEHMLYLCEITMVLVLFFLFPPNE